MISKAKTEVWTMLLALQFMTRLPAAPASAYTAQRFAASVRHYPLIGLMIGCLAALAYLAAATVFPQSLSILLSTAVVLLLTGAFHEDGLADTFDGIGGGLTKARALEIMKDSRIGVFGATALIMVLAIKIGTLSSVDSSLVAISLIAGHCLSRWSSVVAIASSSYVRDSGTGKPTAGGISPLPLSYATLVGLSPLAALYYLYSPLTAMGAAAGLLLGHLAIRWFYQRKIGGYTGDCLGAVQQCSEIGVYLGILACQ